MPLQFTTLPPSGRARERKPLDQIHADIKAGVDEIYEWCQANNGRIELSAEQVKTVVPGTFETAQARAEEFLNDARDYAYQRQPRLVVAGNTTRKGHARLRVTLYVKGGAGEEAVNEEAVNEESANSEG